MDGNGFGLCTQNGYFTHPLPAAVSMEAVVAVSNPRDCSGVSQSERILLNLIDGSHGLRHKENQT